jgi:hypothetical protein
MGAAKPRRIDQKENAGTAEQKAKAPRIIDIPVQSGRVTAE